VDLSEDWDDEDFPWAAIRWESVDVGDDDRTITVHFSAEYDEDAVRPTIKARVAPGGITVRLSMEPKGDGPVGIMLMKSPGSDKTVQLMLAEPVAGRPIVDAWKPPPPPPEVRQTILVNREFGPVAAGRQLWLDSIDIYDEFGCVNYRLRPGQRRVERGGEHDDEVPLHHLWDLDVEDDLGTEYEVPSGGYGGDEEQTHGDRDFNPPPPTGAKALTLVVYDLREDQDFIEIGRCSVTLERDA